MTIYPHQYGYDLAKSLHEEAATWYPGLSGQALKDHILDRITDHQINDPQFEDIAWEFDNAVEPDAAWELYEHGIDDYLSEAIH